MKQLSGGTWSELKTFSEPPEQVKSVLIAVATLVYQNLDYDTWVKAKQILGKVNFIRDIAKIDPNSIPKSVMHKLM